MSGAIQEGISEINRKTPRPTTFDQVRSAQPHTLGDLVNAYPGASGAVDPNEYTSAVANGGAVSHLSNESAYRLEVTGTTNSSALIRTKTMFRYQAGKQLVWLMTVIHTDAGQANQVRRWGFFDDGDGLFFARAGTVLSVVRRSSTSGSPVDEYTAQSDWNIDRLDGSQGPYNPSRLTLDITKDNIYEARFRWLSAGPVDFFINGRLVHVLDLPGTLDVPFMRTATLPLSWQIINTSTSTASSMRYVCASVLVDGGTEAPEHSFAFEMPAPVQVGAVYAPVMSIRIASVFRGLTNRRVLIPALLSLSSEILRGRVRLIWNASLTGATWSATVDESSSAQVDVGATSYASGSTLGSVFIPPNAGPGIDLSHVFGVHGRRLRAGATDTLTIAAHCEQGGNTDIDGAIAWREIL